MKPIFAVVIAAVIAGCTEAPQNSLPSSNLEASAFRSAGATGFKWPELIEGRKVTITYPNAVIVYDTDGNKIFTPTGERVVERKWRKRSDGVICEELVGSGEEACVSKDENKVLLRLNSDLRQFNPANGKFEFTIVKTGPGTYVASEA